MDDGTVSGPGLDERDLQKSVSGSERLEWKVGRTSEVKPGPVMDT